ncbi:hypothetical protein FHS72_002189 [Loktanella ponticola]|uniref:Transferrin-binding protein B C-lobe/N-lobe beta barrel domain-containing protein n=1 Tax=Yoonia ponticola TaxID=1524255 RepID=A0A7W9BL76_9RHOB|nr:hypothetical protein [Yoonia ponticola]MBB5722563.1 hypothetical protein [Yoonia ponticola]
MRILPVSVLLLSAAAMSACETTQDQATMSGFTSPSSTGRISGDLSGNPVVPIIDEDGDGFSFTAGSVSGEGLKAVAGLVAGTDVSFRPSVGSASYDGVYALTYVDDISLDNGYIRGERDATSGAITLTADFARGTLVSSNSPVTVNGKLDGRDLSGTVSYRGVNGQLDGLVGGDKTVGAFHGNNANLIYAGGFIAYRE